MRSAAGTAGTLAEMYATGLVELTPGGFLLVAGYYVDEGEYGNAALAVAPFAIPAAIRRAAPNGEPSFKAG